MAHLIEFSTMVNEREKLIGARLRAFREMLQIPRSRFAVTIGFGSERLASYEAGRAPVLYNVFRAVAQNFNLNPRWLAGDGGNPLIADIVDDAAFTGQIPQRALFSEIYDSHLVGLMKKSADDADQNSRAFFNHQKKQIERARDQSLPIETRREITRRVVEQTEEYLSRLAAENNARNAIKLKSNMDSGKLDLTKAESIVINSDVKSPLPAFLERIKKASSATGKKSELAKFLGAPLASVSRWLSGEREPGAEITLKMLKWVEQQERQK